MNSNLITRRIELGITRKDIANILEYSISHYSNIEKGKEFYILENYIYYLIY